MVVRFIDVLFPGIQTERLRFWTTVLLVVLVVVEDRGVSQTVVISITSMLHHRTPEVMNDNIQDVMCVVVTGFCRRKGVRQVLVSTNIMVTNPSNVAKKSNVRNVEKKEIMENNTVTDAIRSG